MRATNTKDGVLIRLPTPLYDYLSQMFEAEGPHYSTSNKTERQIMVYTTDDQGRPRHYRVVPTVTRPRLEKKIA